MFAICQGPIGLNGESGSIIVAMYLQEVNDARLPIARVAAQIDELLKSFPNNFLLLFSVPTCRKYITHALSIVPNHPADPIRLHERNSPLPGTSQRSSPTSYERRLSQVYAFSFPEFILRHIYSCIRENVLSRPTLRR